MMELYLNKPGDLVLREANALPEVKKGEVKLKVTYGGICGSDLKVYKGLISLSFIKDSMMHSAATLLK